jgi:hypothetical protein
MRARHAPDGIPSQAAIVRTLYRTLQSGAGSATASPALPHGLFPRTFSADLRSRYPRAIRLQDEILNQVDRPDVSGTQLLGG